MSWYHIVVTISGPILQNCELQVARFEQVGKYFLNLSVKSKKGFFFVQLIQNFIIRLINILSTSRLTCEYNKRHAHNTNI